MTRKEGFGKNRQKLFITWINKHLWFLEEPTFKIPLNVIPKKIDTQLEIKLSELEENLMKKSKITRMLIKFERELLQDLTNDKTIIVKSIDKGSTIEFGIKRTIWKTVKITWTMTLYMEKYNVFGNFEKKENYVK